MLNDEQIGENLAKLRGELSQKDLADAMRQRGFKWSQATVWSIEKGERPLRLTEADAVAEILHESVNMLMVGEMEYFLRMEYRRAHDLREQIADLAAEHFEAQRQLAVTLDSMGGDPLGADDEPRLDILDTAIGAAAEGLARAIEDWDAANRVNTRIDGPQDQQPDRYTAYLQLVRETVDRFPFPGDKGDV